jgi:hypothetical protein
MNKYATKQDVSNSNIDQLRNLISINSNKCKSIVIITGFLTKKGFEELTSCIDQQKIKKIVVGVYTSSAQKAFEFISKNPKYSHIKLYIFNNRILDPKNSYSEDENSIKFSPILHAKIIAGYDKEIVWAYTGSANLTDFAFNDKNIESGVFLDNSGLLKSIDVRVKKICTKKNILKYNDLQNSIVCNPTNSDPDIYQIPKTRDNNYKSLKSTYIVFVNSPLRNRSTNIIGLYSKYFDALPENIFSLRTKIILVFSDNIMEPTIVKAPAGERDTLKDPDDIDMYIQRKTEQVNSGFFIEDSYMPNSQNKKFVILENRANQETIEEYNKIIDEINTLFKINLFKKSLDNYQLIIENDDYKKNIIIEPAKQKVILDLEKLKDKVFNMNHLELTTIKDEITLFDLKPEDKRLKEPISLKIKKQ